LNWDAIGAIGEVLGAVAVVVTLIYLAVQLRQNTVATLGDRLDAHFDSICGWYQQLSDATVADIWLRGVRGFNALSQVEQVQFNSLAIQVMLSYEEARTLTKQGLYAKKDLEPEESWIITFVNTPGGRAWWKLSAGDWNQELKHHINSLKIPSDYAPTLLLRTDRIGS
jgi:hypothetical protein